MRSLCMVGAALVFFGGCEFKCNVGGFSKKKIQKKIEKTLASQGIEAKATCPKIEKNSKATCTAKTGEGKTIIVEVVTDAKKAHFETKNVVFGPKVQALIVKQYKTKHNIAVADVRCPKIAFSGATTSCSGRSQGVELEFRVSVGESKLQAAPGKGFIFSAKLAKLIQGALKTPHKVDCGQAVRVSKPGSRFTCNTQLPTGAKQAVHVLVTDTAGNIRYGAVPPQ